MTLFHAGWTSVFLVLLGAAGIARAEGCGRLQTGDTFDDLNKILDCIEARMGTGTVAAPVSTAKGVTVYSEEIEPNNRIGEANELTPGTTVSGRLKDGGEFDMFRFVAPEGATSVRVIMRQTDTAGFYPRLTIYDETETKVSQVNGALSQTMSLAIDTEAHKTYFITIACSQLCPKNMPYELLVRPE